MAATNKILCLHGYAMNSDWLRDWLRPLEQALAGRAELIYLQAPIAVAEADVRATTGRFQAVVPDDRLGPGLNWCWYRASDEKPPRYSGLEQSLDVLHDLFAQQGPIRGVLGWSQGAVVAAMLAGLMKRDPGSGFPFELGVFCGGFLPGAPEYRRLFAEPLKMPSLHVIGRKESDFMRTQGEKLLAAFEASERLDTPVGHVLPIKHPEYMTKIANWIGKRCY